MPTLNAIHPAAALPGGEIELFGDDLGATFEAPLEASIAGVSALVTLARPSRATIRIFDGTLPGDLVVSRDGVSSAPLPLHVAVPMAENLHPVANPVVDAFGNVYTTLSGSRGQQTPVSIFRISPAPEGVVHELRPFARDILNPFGLAFGPDGLLYVSSRAEGIVYQVGSTGGARIYAEGLGIATGIAFDSYGALYVGDRSGTIFKIPAGYEHGSSAANTFVFATLPPSIAAYHLAFSAAGTLYVTGPTTSSHQVIHAIDRDGNASIFFTGLGRPQGLAFDPADNLYVAASFQGERGLLRITPDGTPTLVVAGSNILGVCLLSNGRASLATRDAVFEVTLEV